MLFGENLKKLRKKKKLSQDDLAEKVNVSRQSVSKWENGDAYPEMNNILELCKIFNCKINDLVNDEIKDFDSMDEEKKTIDEEIKMKVAKLKKEKQEKMKGLSKVISTISKIGRILVGISIPIVMVTMIIMGILISRVEVVNNEISFKDRNERLVITTDEDDLKVWYNNKLVASDIEQKDLKVILDAKDLFLNNNKYLIFTYVEVGFGVLLITLLMAYKLLKHLELLFINFNSGDTPFTLENVDHIKKMAYLMIAMIILPNILGLIFGGILKMDVDGGIELFNLIEILFLFSLSYIFEYGYEIQRDSNGKMYDEN